MGADDGGSGRAAKMHKTRKGKAGTETILNRGMSEPENEGKVMLPRNAIIECRMRNVRQYDNIIN